MPRYLYYQILKLPQRLLSQGPGVAADGVAQLRERILQRGRGCTLRGEAPHQAEPGLRLAQRGAAIRRSRPSRAYVSRSASSARRMLSLTP